MSKAGAEVATSLVIAFGQDGNCGPFVREGWCGSEAGFRWTEGGRSVLALPAFAPSEAFVLTLHLRPISVGGVQQRLSVEINGVPIGDEFAPEPHSPIVLEAPGGIVRATGENRLVFHHPHALAPCDHVPGNRDNRLLAFMWTRLEFEPGLMSDDAAPALLPVVDASRFESGVVAECFQSLGQNCEFGLVQRRCGVEPIGLLRFASIFPEALLTGLRTRFSDIGKPEALSFLTSVSGELIGVHSLYGLHYHTFKKSDEVDVVAFQRRETQRLAFLARLLIEQIENNEKIFVRRGGFATFAEMRGLWRLLQSFHPQARLLLVQEVPPGAPERAGQVECVALNLYRGHLTKFADPERVPATLPYEEWLKICAAVYAHERGEGKP